MEIQGIDAVAEPRMVRELELGLGLGQHAGRVRAYAEGRLTLCQTFSSSQEADTAARYSVEVVEDHTALGCQDLGIPPGPGTPIPTRTTPDR